MVERIRIVIFSGKSFKSELFINAVYIDSSFVSKSSFISGYDNRFVHSSSFKSVSNLV